MHWDFKITATLVIFCITYAGLAIGHILWLRLDRTGIAFLGAVSILAFSCISLHGAIDSVNFDALLLLFGLMVVSSQLHYAGFYKKIAEKISSLLSKPQIFMMFLMTCTGILSSVLNNDVVCLAFTPVIAAALMKKNMNPVPFLIALALSSNIGCALTIIGNAQNVLLGQIAGLHFGTYLLWASVPVVLSMLAAYRIVIVLSRGKFHLDNDGKSAALPEDDTPFDLWRSIKGTGIIVIMIILFFTDLPKYLVAMTGAGILLCSHRLDSKKVLALVDWQLLLLFIGLFVVVGAFKDSGLADFFLKSAQNAGININNSYVLTLGTGALSNMINNSAAVMLLVKVVNLGSHLNSAIIAMSNTFAGNFLIIGSLANIIVVQSASNSGVKISFAEFARYGIPVSSASFVILIAWVFISKLAGWNL